MKTLISTGAALSLAALARMAPDDSSATGNGASPSPFESGASATGTAAGTDTGAAAVTGTATDSGNAAANVGSNGSTASAPAGGSAVAGTVTSAAASGPLDYDDLTALVRRLDGDLAAEKKRGDDLASRLSAIENAPARTDTGDAAAADKRLTRIEAVVSPFFDRGLAEWDAAHAS